MLRILYSKINVFIWYIVNYSYLPELVRRIARFDIDNPLSRIIKEKNNNLGKKWCRENADSLQELAKEIGFPYPLKSFRNSHEGAYQYALKAVESCPIKNIAIGAYLDILYHICLSIRPNVVVETGVACGWSSLAILSAMAKNNKGKLFSIDMPYPKQRNEKFVGVCVPENLRQKWSLIKKADKDAIPELIKKLTIDLIHYDSDKTYNGRMFAYNALWSVLREGGVLISDDIADNYAFRDFAAQKGKKAWVVIREEDEKYVGILIK